MRDVLCVCTLTTTVHESNEYRYHSHPESVFLRYIHYSSACIVLVEPLMTVLLNYKTEISGADRVLSSRALFPPPREKMR